MSDLVEASPSVLERRAVADFPEAEYSTMVPELMSNLWTFGKTKIDSGQGLAIRSLDESVNVSCILGARDQATVSEVGKDQEFVRDLGEIRGERIYWDPALDRETQESIEVLINRMAALVGSLPAQSVDSPDVVHIDRDGNLLSGDTIYYQKFDRALDVSMWGESSPLADMRLELVRRLGASSSEGPQVLRAARKAIRLRPIVEQNLSERAK